MRRVSWYPLKVMVCHNHITLKWRREAQQDLVFPPSKRHWKAQKWRKCTNQNSPTNIKRHWGILSSITAKCYLRQAQRWKWSWWCLPRCAFLCLFIRIPAALRNLSICWCQRGSGRKLHWTLKVFCKKAAKAESSLGSNQPWLTAVEVCTLTTLPLWIPPYPCLPWVSLFEMLSIWVHHHSLQGVCNHKCRQCILMNVFVKKKKRLIKRKCWSKVNQTIQCWRAAEEPPWEGDPKALLGFCIQMISP